MTKINTSNTPSPWPVAEARELKKPEQTKELKDKVAMEKASSGFEALLLHNMLKEMWGSAGQGGILDENSNEMNIFRDMFNQAIADEVVKGDGIGVKKFLNKELSKSQDVASKSLGKV